MDIYNLRKNMTEEVINGVCVYCSDPRSKVGLWRRIKQHLVSPDRRIAPIGLLGGPISLAYPEYLPIEYALLMVQQIPFTLRKFPEVKEIIVVGHDCGYYEQIPHQKKATVARKKKDIAKAARLLKRHFPELAVVAFFADEKSDGFERIQY